MAIGLALVIYWFKQYLSHPHISQGDLRESPEAGRPSVHLRRYIMLSMSMATPQTSKASDDEGGLMKKD